MALKKAAFVVDQDQIQYAVTWGGDTAIAAGDTCDPLQPDKGWYDSVSVQVTGTFGAAAVTWQISNDGVNYVVATGLGGVAASLSVAGLLQILESARYAKPVITGGSGVALVITAKLLRGQRAMT